MPMPIKNDLSERLTQIQYESYSSKEHSADFQKIINLLITISIIQNRIMEKQQDEEKLAANERRTKSTNELASTYKGLGFNQGTSLVALQAVGTFVAQPIGQIVGSIKGISDEATMGRRTIMQHSIEKIKMIVDDLTRDAQKSQSLMSELTALLKQMESEEHNTASRVS